jgi:hypothetical protein
MNLSSAIALWREELSDVKTTLHPDGKRYRDQQFVAWVNQARQHIYQYYPQWHQKTVVLKLVTGSLQNTCDCNKFYAIDGLSDKDGNIIAPIAKQGSKSASFFPAMPCTPCSNGTSAHSNGQVPEPATPKTYSFDKNIPNRFLLEPPVPATGDYYIRAVCANPPDAFCGTPNDTMCMSAQEFPVLQWYVKSMAHGTLKESAASMQTSERFLALFFKLLGVSRAAEEKYLQQAKATA